jgi:hypothetical protein
LNDFYLSPHFHFHLMSFSFLSFLFILWIVPLAPQIIPEDCSAENNSVTVAWLQPNHSFIQGYVLELDDGSGGEFRVSIAFYYALNDLWERFLFSLQSSHTFLCVVVVMCLCVCIYYFIIPFRKRMKAGRRWKTLILLFLLLNMKSRWWWRMWMRNKKNCD